MSLSTALRTKVAATGAITALIGTKFRPQIAEPDDTLPYTVFFRTSRTGTVHSGGEGTLLETKVVMTHFADDYDECETIASAFRDAFNVLTGTVGTETFRSCVLESESDELDQVQFGQNIPPYFITQQWSIKHFKTPTGL